MTEFRVCPACGYGRGFHVFFHEGDDGIGIGLICPNCGQSYKIGLTAQGISEMHPEQGPAFSSRDQEQGPGNG